MASDDQAITSDRWIRRFRKRFGGRRWSGWSAVAATPSVQWTVPARDSARGSRGYFLRGGGGGGGRALAPVSARKLAAALWRLVATTNGSGSVTWRCRKLFEFYSSSPIPKFVTEEGTKWDYCCSGNAQLDDVNYLRRNAAVFNAKRCIYELKAEGGLSRRINYCMGELNEEIASQRRTEHQQMRSAVKYLADNIKRERRKCKRLVNVNSKLLSDIAGAKLSARKFLQSLEKEKKTRVWLEDECHELAKYIEGSRAEIAVSRDHCARIQEEITEQRETLQMAEVWREECVQMKLVDAKLILEDKLARINNLIGDCEAIMRPSNSTTRVKLMSDAKGRRVAGHVFSHDP